MNRIVKEFMIPIEEYPKVNHNANLYEAITALRGAHELWKDRTYRPRAVLVTDDKGDIIGKLSLWDCLRALEPKYGKIGDFNRLSHFGLSPEFIRSMVVQNELWTDPLDTLCAKAGLVLVGDFISLPGEDAFIGEENSLGEAVHQLVMGKHMALLVTKDKKVVGCLRLCDVFDYIADRVQTCEV